MENYVITCLLVYTVLREIVFVFQTNKLVNKLMSRNYHEYQVGNTLSQPKEKIKLPNQPAEDLGALNHDYRM